MTSPTPIRIACDVAGRAQLDTLTPFQGALKSAPEEELAKLRHEILETGFAFPVYVWKDPSDQKVYIVGGHQRVTVLKRLRDEGFRFPEDQVPVVEVFAASYQEAKRRVLQDVAQYGKIQREGLAEFMKESGMSIGDLESSFRLPDVDVRSFRQQFFPEGAVVQDPSAEWQGMPQFEQQSAESFRHVIVHFPNAESVEKFFKLIEQSDTGKTKSIWFPPQERMETESKRYAADDAQPQ